MYTVETIQADKAGTLVEITERVKEIVALSGVKSGIAVINTPYDDAGILCTSFYDPKGHEDIIDDFNRIWPARNDFHCKSDAVRCAAHSKAAVGKQSMDFIVEDGELKLGGSQGIFFAEYCEPSKREYTVTLLGA
ncbi:MAG: YjbQ family protein [Clostridiales bacterium]|nr:YjbQ family protein [Clostridiales bacterium]